MVFHLSILPAENLRTFYVWSLDLWMLAALYLSLSQITSYGCGMRPKIGDSRKPLLVGSVNPSEKYKSVGIIIPNIWRHKIPWFQTTNQIAIPFGKRVCRGGLWRRPLKNTSPVGSWSPVPRSYVKQQSGATTTTPDNSGWEPWFNWMAIPSVTKAHNPWGKPRREPWHHCSVPPYPRCGVFVAGKIIELLAEFPTMFDWG